MLSLLQEKRGGGEWETTFQIVISLSRINRVFPLNNGRLRVRRPKVEKAPSAYRLKAKSGASQSLQIVVTNSPLPLFCLKSENPKHERGPGRGRLKAAKAVEGCPGLLAEVLPPKTPTGHPQGATNFQWWQESS